MFQDLLWCLYYLIFNPNLEELMNWRIFYWSYAQMFLTQLFWNSNTYLSLVSKKNLKNFCKGSVWNSPLIHKCLNEFIIILCYVHFVYKHGLWTPREEIAFTARPKIQSQSQIFRYGRSIFCLPHQPNFSDIFDFCFHWVSVVRVYKHAWKSVKFVYSRKAKAFISLFFWPYRWVACGLSESKPKLSLGKVYA